MYTYILGESARPVEAGGGMGKKKVIERFFDASGRESLGCLGKGQSGVYH